MNGQELYAMYADELAICGPRRPEQWWFIEQSTRRAWDRVAERLSEDERKHIDDEVHHLWD